MTFSTCLTGSASYLFDWMRLNWMIICGWLYVATWVTMLRYFQPQIGLITALLAGVFKIIAFNRQYFIFINTWACSRITPLVFEQMCHMNQSPLYVDFLLVYPYWNLCRVILLNPYILCDYVCHFTYVKLLRLMINCLANYQLISIRLNRRMWLCYCISDDTWLNYVEL